MKKLAQGFYFWFMYRVFGTVYEGVVYTETTFKIRNIKTRKTT